MKMVSILKTALIVACALPVAAMPAAASAQDNGESRCGADGYVERYSSYVHSWNSSGVHCAGSGGGSYSGRRDGGGGGEPAEGDTKCGADGKVYRYIGHSWIGGIADCR